MNQMVVQNNMAGNGGAMVYRDPAAIAAAETAKAKIQAAYLMALHSPRNTDQARLDILNACKRTQFAERVEYSKPVGGKAIKGASIRFVETALRLWRNIHTESQVIYEDENIMRVQVSVTDLETNTSYSKEIQLRKTVERSRPDNSREVMGERLNTKGEKVYIVAATDDEILNKVAASVSKIVRNEGLRLVPSDIIDEAIETARTTLREATKKDPEGAKKKVLDSFFSVGVKPSDIARFLKHPIEAISPAELEELRKMYRAISDGEATWSSFFDTGNDQENGEQKPSGQTATKPADDPIATFDKQVPKKVSSEALWPEFMTALCAPNGCATIDELKKKSIEEGSVAQVIKAFATWKAKKAEATKATTATKSAPASGNATQAGSAPDFTDEEMAPGECPNREGSIMTVAFCNKCSGKNGCPVWM